MFNIDEARFEQLVQKEAILDVVTNYLLDTEYPTTKTIKTLLGIQNCTEDDVYQSDKCCDNCAYHAGSELCTETGSINLGRITRNGSTCSLWKLKEGNNEQG